MTRIFQLPGYHMRRSGNRRASNLFIDFLFSLIDYLIYQVIPNVVLYQIFSKSPWQQGYHHIP